MLNFNRIKELISPLPKLKLGFSGLVGGGLGLFVSMIVNACLLEMSFNGFFTLVTI